MFYIVQPSQKPTSFVHISTASDWERWVASCLPDTLSREVRRRLISNLKHVIVALEMKAALIVPHAARGGGPSVLFEPYFQIMIFEFCVGVFSLCEGLGAALRLRAGRVDGSAGDRIKFEEWKFSLVTDFDSNGAFALAANVDCVKSVRDKLHQDRLGARQNIDWHDFSYDGAFIPALNAVQCLLRKNAEHVPVSTNLTAT